MLFATIIVAFTLDWFVGEPKRFHPLVGFGLLVKRVEHYCYAERSNTQQIIVGTLAVGILILPFTILCYLLADMPIVGITFNILALTFAIGHKSLHQHATPIADALASNDQAQARYLTSRIVSRDPATLNIPKATIESVLENGADSIFNALFWFVIAGAPGVIAYRLSNTLDAMWGYKNNRYLYFGRFTARLDDCLNYIPARLTGLSYALLGNTKQAIKAWKQQAPACESPNAGVVMASGAGALNLTLGGPAQYDGIWHRRPNLGFGPEPVASDIFRALRLIRHTVLLWISTLFLVMVISYA